MNAKEKLDTYHLPLYGRLPVTLVRGEGAIVWDDNGNEYLDTLAGIAVNSTGHCHPIVVSAIQEQAARLFHVSNIFYNEPQAQLAEKLVNISGLDKATFCNSGAEANEAVIKFIRNYAKKHERSGPIVSFTSCFHGRTIANLAMGKKQYQEGFSPMPDGFHKLKYNNLEMLNDYIKYHKPIGFIIEAIQGEGGINVGNQDFFDRLQQICEEYDIILAIDEVQTGFARTGKYFAFQHYDLAPDLVSCAKGMGSGVPVGAILAKNKIADTLKPGMHGTTFGGNPLVCAAAVATLEVIENENLTHQAQELGDYFRQQLDQKTGNHHAVKEIRGKGLMIGVELHMEGKDIVPEMLKRGMIGNCASGNVMRFVPPLIIRKDQIDKAVDIFAESLEEVYST